MERDYDWYVDVFRRRFAMFRDKCPEAAEVLEKAVRGGQLSVDVGAHNPFYATVFENEFVYKSYYSETHYFFSGLARKILEEPGLPAASAGGEAST